MEDIEDGVEGRSDKALELGGGTLRKGDDDLRKRLDDMLDGPKTGEPPRSCTFLSSSSTVVRMGVIVGNTSSTGFLGVRKRLGEPELDGLAGRNCGGYRIRPEPLTPGIDCVRDMDDAGAATERDRACPLDSGEAVRGLYGKAAE